VVVVGQDRDAHADTFDRDHAHDGPDRFNNFAFFADNAADIGG
jgi:hypothetical protein